MISNLIDRYLGRTGVAGSAPQASISVLTTAAYTAGAVLNEGGQILTLSAVAHGKGDIVRLESIHVWEVTSTGAAITPGIRFYVMNKTYAPPVQNSPFLGPSANAKAIVGIFDVASTDYVTYSDGTLNRAVAHVAASAASVDGGVDMRTATDDTNLYVVAATTGAPTFAADASLHFEFIFST